MSGALTGVVGAPTGVVDISDGFAVDDTLSAPSEAGAAIEFQSDGDVSQTTSLGTLDIGDWITPKAVAPGAYEIMAHQNSGDTVAGSAVDSWIALTSTVSWSLTQSGAGSKSASLTVSISLYGVTLSSGEVTLHAEVI